MAVRKILKIGNPMLYRRADEVAPTDVHALQSLISDMFETMRSVGGIGLAAPQIGVNKRVLVFQMDKSDRYPDAEPLPRTVLINPVLAYDTENRDFAWEGCLSVPGMRGYVERFQSISVKALDESGAPVEFSAANWLARVVQHEHDHLEGILYPMRLKDIRHLVAEEEWSRDQSIELTY